MKHLLKYIKLIPVVAFMAGLACSCVEPFEFHSMGYDRAIVVEGRITDRDHGHYVKLSYTRPIDQRDNDPIKGATVWVEASNGSRIEFNETSPGYYTCSEGVSGVVGLQYQLFFTTSDGRRYQSNQQVLLASPSIDSIYPQYAERASGTSGSIKKGIQFFVDSHEDSKSARHFRYEWEETYEVQAPYPSLYEFFSDPDTVVFRSEQINICYVSGKSSRITIATTANLTESRLSEMPIRYLTSETDHLRYAYSILVRQFGISPGAYGFYRELLENNENNESLFERQLGVVVGNITSVENPEETVLGFFEVSGVSERRAFFRYKDLDERFPWPRALVFCDDDPRTLYDFEQPLPYKLLDSVGIYIREGYEITTAAYCDSLNHPRDMPPCRYYFKADLLPKNCTDCRLRGPATKPDFWIY